MLLEQVYFLFIYIIIIELAIVTVVAIALFVALVVTVRKLDNIKNTSLSGISMTRHISVVAHLIYLLY